MFVKITTHGAGLEKYSPAPRQEDLAHFQQVRVPDLKGLEQRC